MRSVIQASWRDGEEMDVRSLRRTAPAALGAWTIRAAAAVGQVPEDVGPAGARGREQIIDGADAAPPRWGYPAGGRPPRRRRSCSTRGSSCSQAVKVDQKAGPYERRSAAMRDPLWILSAPVTSRASSDFVEGSRRPAT